MKKKKPITENHTILEEDKGSQNYLIYYKDTPWRTDLTVYWSLEWYMPKCTVVYIKVHCHNRLTKHFSSRTVKASPLFPPQSPGTVTEDRAQATHVGGSSSEREGGRGDTAGGKGTVTATSKTRQSDDRQGCKTEDTEHRGTGRGTEKQGERQSFHSSGR